MGVFTEIKLLTDSILSRLLNCAAHPNNKLIKSPRAGIINVALADPATLSIHKDSQYLWSKRHDAWVMTSLVGKTAHFSASNIRQICVRPFMQGWLRFVAVLAEVCNHDTLHFQSFRGGITFGSSTYSSNGNRTGVSTTVEKGEVAPVKGSRLGEHEKSACTCFILPKYPYICTVPVYDGREEFHLSQYWARPYEGAVERDSAVMVLFTVNKSGLSKAMKEAKGVPKCVKFALYFNLLGIIVLEDPVDDFSRESLPGAPESFGVSTICKFEAEVKGQEHFAEDDDEDEEVAEVPL